MTSLEINYGPVHSPPRLLQGETEVCCRLDGRYRFVGRSGVVAVGHHLFAEGVDGRPSGRGKRLFQDGDATVPLRLADSKTFSTGVLSLTYRPAGG